MDGSVSVFFIVSHLSISVLIQVKHYFGYCSFIISLEINVCSPDLFFEIILAPPIPLLFTEILFYFFKLFSLPFFSIYFYYLEANYFTVLQWFLSYIDMNQPWVYMCSPSRSPLPPPSPPDPSGSSQCTRPEHLSHASSLGW